jgi:hypothetical protein
VIWGGWGAGGALNDGAIFDLKTKKWEELPEAPIVGRWFHTGLLWGSKLVIWGGWGGRRRFFNDGAILDLKRLELIGDLEGD